MEINLNFIDFRLLHFYAQNKENFVLKIWEISEMVKTGVDRQ